MALNSSSRRHRRRPSTDPPAHLKRRPLHFEALEDRLLLSTVGLFRPSTNQFYLKNTNSAGTADVVFRYGPAASGWTPLVGDWDGNSSESVGLFKPSTSQFFLKNANTPGPADLAFRFGPKASGWTPLVGDWDGDGTATIGLYVPSKSTFYLKNSNSPGPADLAFRFGPKDSGWTPLVGDWDGNGTETVGLYVPSKSTFYLKNSNAPGPADLAFRYGPAASGWTPLVGDWNGGDLANVPSDAGMTDANGLVVLNVAGQDLSYALIDESTGEPLVGVAVGLALDPETQGFGVMTIIDPLETFPIQYVVVTADEAEDALQSATVGFDSAVEPGALAAQSNTVISVSKLGTAVVQAVTDFNLPRVGKKLATAIKLRDLTVLLLKITSQLSPVPFDLLETRPPELLTPDEAMNQIREEIISNLATEAVILGVTAGLGAPVSAFGVVVDLLNFGIDGSTVLNCNEPLITVRTVGAGPFKVKLYGCEPIPLDLSNLVRVSVKAEGPFGQPLGTGSLQMLSEGNQGILGLGFQVPIDASGNAVVDVPQGAYQMVVRSPSFIPDTRAVSVPIEGLSLVITMESGVDPPPPPPPTCNEGDVCQFDGSYTGSYNGTAIPIFGDPFSVSGGVAFSVSNGSITITVPESGTGTVSASGTADIGTAGGTLGDCTYSGTFVASSGSAFASGSWFCSSSVATSSGSWSASGGSGFTITASAAPEIESEILMLDATAVAVAQSTQDWDPGTSYTDPATSFDTEAPQDEQADSSSLLTASLDLQSPDEQSISNQGSGDPLEAANESEDLTLETAMMELAAEWRIAPWEDTILSVV